jgi:hypothetical protein
MEMKQRGKRAALISGRLFLSTSRSTKPLAKARACVILFLSGNQSGGVGAASAGVSRLTKPDVALEGGGRRGQ